MMQERPSPGPTQESTMRVSHLEGLHGRPSTDIANYVQSLPNTRVTLAYGDARADASSIMQVLMLTVPHGAEISVQVEGPNPEETLRTIRSFI